MNQNIEEPEVGEIYKIKCDIIKKCSCNTIIKQHNHMVLGNKYEYFFTFLKKEIDRNGIDSIYHFYENKKGIFVIRVASSFTSFKYFISTTKKII